MSERIGRLNTTIEGLLHLGSDESEDEQEYQAEFAYEGSRKSEYIIDNLVRMEAEGKLRTPDLAYLCIGGADGSEPLAVLKSTSICKAVMIEISDAGATAARSAAEDLKRTTGDELVVFQGDAAQRLPNALEHIRGWADEGAVSGLVISAQAVLHELPTRSPGFDLSHFLGTLFGGADWDVCAFFSREPCEPSGWPEFVSIRIRGVEDKRFAEAARYIGDKLHIKGEVRLLSGGWINMPSILAIETLHKLIRGDGVRRLRYELGEQLTSFRPLDAKRLLEKFVPSMGVQVSYIMTEGFRRAMSDYEVEYAGPMMAELPLPQTHAELVGLKPTSIVVPSARSTRSARSARSVSEVCDLAALAAKFGGAVEGSQIEEWVGQFKVEDWGIVNRLLQYFVFIDGQRFSELLKDLAAVVRGQLGDRFDDCIFVQSGGVATSSGFVTYNFKRINNLPSGQFLASNDSDLRSLGDKPIVLLDDLLASGHQALGVMQRLQETLGGVHQGPVVLATAVSCAAGRAYLRERTDMILCAGEELGRELEPFSSPSIVFPDDAQRSSARLAIRRYGETLLPMAPLGYAGNSLLLAFQHSPPDNCLPIFWSDHDNWIPLLRRRGSARTMSD